MICRAAIVIGLGLLCSASGAAEPVPPGQLRSKLSYPVAGDSGYVLIEVWPSVKAITLNAYFGGCVIR
jgi:hypothetical protein